MDYLNAIMNDADDQVTALIRKRIKAGKIKDLAQTRKSVAGNGFQGLVAYSLIHLQEEGLLPDHLLFVLKPKKHSLIDQYATIKVGNDVQKPDIDLLVYSANDSVRQPILIYSMKTSLRERAGQTYRWKLLMDIATSKDATTIKEKYGLSSKASNNFKVGFITTNFYNEIMNPQQRGALSFFDFVYLCKPGDWDTPVRNFSAVAGDLREIYA
ncbi:MAG: hypothetical protein FJ030_12015 [Chloroflexi bacterium]|nr:hypothetical protein [Chloroflexota bacterium]